jgi:hypothetical protein
MCEKRAGNLCIQSPEKNLIYEMGADAPIPPGGYLPPTKKGAPRRSQFRSSKREIFIFTSYDVNVIIASGCSLRAWGRSLERTDFISFYQVFDPLRGRPAGGGGVNHKGGMGVSTPINDV